MKEKIQQEMSNMEAKIEDKTKWLNVHVSEFKECAAKYDAHSIATFIPGMVSIIDEEHKEIAALNDKLRMLVWLMKEADDE